LVKEKFVFARAGDKVRIWQAIVDCGGFVLKAGRIVLRQLSVAICPIGIPKSVGYVPNAMLNEIFF
jgi:hypothetical protein